MRNGRINFSRDVWTVLVIGLMILNTIDLPAAKKKPDKRETEEKGCLKTGVVFTHPFLDGSGRSGPEMVYIVENSFIMGGNPRAPGYIMTEVPHRVELSPYAIGKYEITNMQYCEFLNEKGNNSTDNLPYVLIDTAGGNSLCLVEDEFRPAPGAARRPVVRVSWKGALAYTEWLSLKAGQNYCLPTEAQWEYAARAGTQTIWPWGNRFQPGKLNCNNNESEIQPQPVGQYPPNAFGIHDMLGNVWEWIIDCFALDFYFYSPTRDPILLDKDCLAPGIRGGSFRDRPQFCRPGFRVNLWWRGNYDGVGFRVVCCENKL